MSVYACYWSLLSPSKLSHSGFMQQVQTKPYNAVIFSQSPKHMEAMLETLETIKSI